jgi:hypothetical protein
MRNKHVIIEVWPFQCLHCRRTWEGTYEAWHADDGHGGDVVTWRHDGVIIMPPWIDPSCAGCHSLHVKVLPPGARLSP